MAAHTEIMFNNALQGASKAQRSASMRQFWATPEGRARMLAKKELKLDAEKAAAIRALYAAEPPAPYRRPTLRQIGEEFWVSAVMAWKVVNDEAWV